MAVSQGQQPPETVFTYGAPLLKFGAGAVDEIGYDLAQYGVRRALVITDAGVAATGIPERVVQRLKDDGIDSRCFAGVHVEPTDESMRRAVEDARADGPWDAFVAVGGGSTIDTAKAVNLLTTNPGELADYLNPPLGEGRAPREPLKPLVAVPTTTGTGSESTTVCVLDVLSAKVKTGISHPRLRPTLAVVDPTLTVSQPRAVTAASGMDVLCHALESYTARPYTSYPRKRPDQRVPYCGANPISDLWCEQALRLLATSLRAAVGAADDGGNDSADSRAREAMALAATMAGLGFGNAGVHIPHANAYPIAGMVGDFRPDGYPPAEPLVPHGMAVALTAPEAFRFTFDAAPERHLRAAALLEPGGEHAGAHDGAHDGAEPRERLPLAVTRLMRDVGIPNGVAAVGYTVADVPSLVDGAMKQRRLLATAPREVTPADLDGIFTRSMANW